MSCGQHDPGHWHACLAGGLTCHCSLPVQASEPARVPSPPARVPRPVRRRRADCDWPGQRPPTPSYWHAGVGVWPGLGPGVGSGDSGCQSWPGQTRAGGGPGPGHVAVWGSGSFAGGGSGKPQGGHGLIRSGECSILTSRMCSLQDPEGTHEKSIFDRHPRTRG